MIKNKWSQRNCPKASDLNKITEATLWVVFCWGGKEFINATHVWLGTVVPFPDFEIKKKKPQQIAWTYVANKIIWQMILFDGEMKRWN
ncbi:MULTISPECIES: hypothetical protein [unclassified Allomuricauda]|uniref:hypothetical protein n=1 Tax=unclassified Allomuricauda TaxID=2615049 RepID=UPI00273F0B1B|nr:MULTISPECIES: hypothetical protein [unclassified Allomuricauda]